MKFPPKTRTSDKTLMTLQESFTHSKPHFIAASWRRNDGREFEVAPHDMKNMSRSHEIKE